MRRVLKTVTVVGFSVLAGLLVPAPSALAQDDEGPDTDDQVVITGRLVVPEGETVEHAVIFNGPATIEGTVGQSLVVWRRRS